MPAPTTTLELIDLVRRSNLIESAQLDGFLAAHPEPAATPSEMAKRLASAGLLTGFHVEQLLRGKRRGFFLGKYKLLDRLGSGGMGQVFLAEHLTMKRRVAVKVLPPDMAADEFARARFMREARAVGQLDHPNLVRAFDIETEGDVIFLVMEYIEGINLHALVTKFGPLDPARAAYYLWQAANGLNYVHTTGLVHRDVKPANLLVDRFGTVKLLDLGLVRTFGEDNELTRGQGVRILGTADYLAPEQAVDCSTVDIRADIYSLGATGFFLLTGKQPYGGDKVAAKLIAHQTKPVPRVEDHRSDVPEELCAILVKMMAKRPADRFQSPAELAAALEQWAYVPPPVPSEQEIPVGVGTAPAVSAAIRGAMPSRVPLTPSPRGSGGVVVLASPSTGATGGSAIRLFQPPSDVTPRPPSSGNLLPQSAINTPPPGWVPTPPPIPAPFPPRTAPTSSENRAGLSPPVLPAGETHGLGADPLHGPESSGRLPNPFKTPTPLAMKKPGSVSPTRRWMSVAAAGVVMLAAVGVVLAKNGAIGGNRSDVKPVPATAAKPGPSR